MKDFENMTVIMRSVRPRNFHAPRRKKHHDRYAVSGISCICLIALDHLLGIENVKGGQAGTKDNAIYLYAVRWLGPGTEACPMREQAEVIIMPPPENQK